MKTAPLILQHSFRTIAPLPLLFFTTAITLISCTSTHPIKQAGMHYFTFQGEEYRIRTIVSSIEGESRNELIGRTFLAIDLNQDCRIDRIQLGDVDHSRAQEIYEYCIDSLIKDKKLKLIKRQENTYHIRDVFFDYEVKSYTSADSNNFNEFCIFDKRTPSNQVRHIYHDQHSDGKLDKLISGTISLQDAQIQYTRLINKGLKSGNLFQHSHQILVRKQ